MSTQLIIPATVTQETKDSIKRLYLTANQGRIRNLWSEDFIQDMRKRLDTEGTFTEGEVARVTRLGERY